MNAREIQQQLFSLQDLKYKEFQCKLMPGVDTDTVIGVRTPELHQFAHSLAKEKHLDTGIQEFLSIMPHQFYDEMNLHGLIISLEDDYEVSVREIDKMLPYIDNWATCDLFKPIAFKRKANRSRLLSDIQRWMGRKPKRKQPPYTIRFGMEMLMLHYLDEEFKPEYLDWVADVRHEHYYVRMMQAWFIATALTKQWDATLPIIQKCRLETWTHNKAIQKAIESYRITNEQKALLRTLKIKDKK